MLLYKGSCLPPLSFLSLERVQTVDSLRSHHRAVVLFETVCGSPHVQGFMGPACSKLSGHPHPPLATLSCYAFSISCPLLGFTAHIKPSPSPPSHVKTPDKENSERGMGFYAVPLCPVPRAVCYTPASLWPGEHLVTCGKNPSASKEQPKPYFPGSQQNERKKEFFLSLVFLPQTSVHSILRLPGHHS